MKSYEIIFIIVNFFTTFFGIVISVSIMYSKMTNRIVILETNIFHLREAIVNLKEQINKSINK